MVLGLAWGVAVLAHALLIFAALTHSPVDVDEGYNLSVVRNIVNGDGYRSDGVYEVDSSPWFNGTTGPTLILPAAALHGAGVDLFFAGRITGTVGYLVMLVGLGLLGRQIAGRWGALAASSAPLLLDLFSNDYSPIYSPGDLLGEYLATGLVAFALLAARRRAWLSGLMFGLAVLTKIVVLAFAPILLIAVLGLNVRPWRRTILRVLAWGVCVALPLLAFEVVKIATLGLDRYRELASTYSGRVGEERSPEWFADEKAMTVIDSWFVSPIVVWLVSLTVACLIAVALMVMPPVGDAGQPRWREPRVQLALGAFLMGPVNFLAWAMSRATAPEWVRNAAPGLLLSAAGIMAAAVLTVRAIERWGGPKRRRGALIAAAVLGLVAAVGAGVHVTKTGAVQRLMIISHQQAIADQIAATGVEEVQGIWGPMVPLAALADVRANTIMNGLDEDTLLVFDKYPRAHLAAQGAYLADNLCGERLANFSAVICWPKEGAAQIFDEMISGVDEAPDEHSADEDQPEA